MSNKDYKPRAGGYNVPDGALNTENVKMNKNYHYINKRRGVLKLFENRPVKNNGGKI